MAENMEKWPGFSFLFLVLMDFFLAAMAKNLKESLHDVGESWRDPPANVSWLIHYDNLLESDSVGLWNRFGVWHSSSGTHLHLICILMEPAQLLAWDTVEFPSPSPPPHFFIPPLWNQVDPNRQSSWIAMKLDRSCPISLHISSAD